MFDEFIIIAGCGDTWVIGCQPMASDALVEPPDWVSTKSLAVGLMD